MLSSYVKRLLHETSFMNKIISLIAIGEVYALMVIQTTEPFKVNKQLSWHGHFDYTIAPLNHLQQI